MKRSPSLRALSSEHHAGLVLVRRIALIHDHNEALPMWHQVEQYFETKLEAHFQSEEKFLLPALARACEKALVTRTLHEHNQLRSLVHGGKKNLETLKLFANLLQAHIRYEERELFEQAQRIAGFSNEAQGLSRQ